MMMMAVLMVGGNCRFYQCTTFQRYKVGWFEGQVTRMYSSVFKAPYQIDYPDGDRYCMPCDIERYERNTVITTTYSTSTYLKCRI